MEGTEETRSSDAWLTPTGAGEQGQAGEELPIPWAVGIPADQPQPAQRTRYNPNPEPAPPGRLRAIRLLRVIPSLPLLPAEMSWGFTKSFVRTRWLNLVLMRGVVMALGNLRRSQETRDCYMCRGKPCLWAAQPLQREGRGHEQSLANLFFLLLSFWQLLPFASE